MHAKPSRNHYASTHPPYVLWKSIGSALKVVVKELGQHTIVLCKGKSADFAHRGVAKALCAHTFALRAVQSIALTRKVVVEALHRHTSP